MESILAALITGVLALVGVIVTSLGAGRKVETALEKHQAVTDTKLEELTREVREHNHFARRMPVVEHEIKAICRRLQNLEQAQ